MKQDIPIEECYEEMTNLYMEVSTISYQVKKCLNTTTEKDDKKVNRTMKSYGEMIKSLDSLQTSADECVSSTDNMLEVATAMICIKPVRNFELKILKIFVNNNLNNFRLRSTHT